MSQDSRMKISDLMKGFEQVCRSKDLRITHQRMEIFHELAKYPGHPTADNVFNRVRKRLKTISLDTVYRTILTFEKNGLIKRVQILDNIARFDINISVHHHLVCTQCKIIEDFYWPDFDQMNLPTTIDGWPKIFSRHVEIRGLCRDCGIKHENK
jgi:Fur family transcriptional regulator, peroxide stress response regulator